MHTDRRATSDQRLSIVYAVPTGQAYVRVHGWDCAEHTHATWLSNGEGCMRELELMEFEGFSHF